MLQINVSKVDSTQNSKQQSSTNEKAEASISPTIILPLLTGEKDKSLFKVRALLDSGSGTNWIVASLLKHVVHTVKGTERLEVITFSGKVYKKFPLVEVLYPTQSGKADNILCYAHDTFTTHVAVKGMVEYIRKEAKQKSDLLDRLVDPSSMEIDHANMSLGIGLILCSATINKLRTAESSWNIPNINILLEPTIFGVAISGAIPNTLRCPQATILAQNIAPRMVDYHQDPRLFCKA